MKDVIKRLVSSEQTIEMCYKDMKRMLNEHGFLSFEIKRGHRSLSQNALYWVWIPTIRDYLNKTKPQMTDENGNTYYPDDYTEDETHVIVKKLFLGVEPAIMKGDEVFVSEQVRSTKKLSKGEMFDFMQKIHHWMVSRDVYLPLPEDSVYMELMNKQVA